MSMQILAGTSYPELGELVRKRLGAPTAYEALSSSVFSNGETFVSIGCSVRGADVYIIQTAAEPVNDMLMELLIAVSACKMASARHVTAVVPCFPYARQDKKDRSRAPITAKLVATMLEGAGCSHVITMDLHASQIQGFFSIPVDNVCALSHLYSEKCMIEYIGRTFASQDFIIVSPDAGGTKRAAAIADRLRVDLAIIHKERKVANQVSRMILVGDVAGRTAILVDDIADTCGTLAMASRVLREHGAVRSVAVVAHGFLSGPSVDVVEKSNLESLVVTNTLPLPPRARQSSKIRQMDVSGTIAEAIRRTHHGESVSMLFT